MGMGSRNVRPLSSHHAHYWTAVWLTGLCAAGTRLNNVLTTPEVRANATRCTYGRVCAVLAFQHRRSWWDLQSAAISVAVTILALDVPATLTVLFFLFSSRWLTQDSSKLQAVTGMQNTQLRITRPAASPSTHTHKSSLAVSEDRNDLFSEEWLTRSDDEHFTKVSATNIRKFLTLPVTSNPWGTHLPTAVAWVVRYWLSDLADECFHLAVVSHYKERVELEYLKKNTPEDQCLKQVSHTCRSEPRASNCSGDMPVF